jgi:hypothetical protein
MYWEEEIHRFFSDTFRTLEGTGSGGGARRRRGQNIGDQQVMESRRR